MANNLILGRGELWFDRYADGTMNTTGEIYIGNTPEISIAFESEDLDHVDMDHGVGEVDESITTSVARSATFTTDNIKADNVALFFFGSMSILSQASGSVVAEPIVGVKAGATYQLGTSSVNPSGVRNISAVAVKDAVPTTFVAGTDYTIDLVLGRLTILAAGAIDDGDNILVDYTRSAVSRERVISGSKAIAGAMRYISFNPTGPQQDYYMPYVKISPNGDFPLKAESDWQAIPFNVKILKKSPLEALYQDGRAYTP